MLWLYSPAEWEKGGMLPCDKGTQTKGTVAVTAQQGVSKAGTNSVSNDGMQSRKTAHVPSLLVKAQLLLPMGSKADAEPRFLE